MSAGFPSDRMQALVFDKPRPVVKTVPIPHPPAGWARIRVRLAGICGTDLEIARGYRGFEGVAGHEFVGVVETTD